MGRLYTRKCHYSNEASNLAIRITCVPDIKQQVNDLPPMREEPNEETKYKVYNALCDKSKRREVIISGAEGSGKTYGVTDVAYKLQRNFNYKFLPLDLKKTLPDVHHNTAVDIIKELLPTGHFMDILGIILFKLRLLHRAYELH